MHPSPSSSPFGVDGTQLSSWETLPPLHRTQYLLSKWMNKSILPDQTCCPLNDPYSIHSLVKHLLSARSVCQVLRREQGQAFAKFPSWTQWLHGSLYATKPLLLFPTANQFYNLSHICPLGPILLLPPQSKAQLACCKPRYLSISSCPVYV